MFILSSRDEDLTGDFLRKFTHEFCFYLSLETLEHKSQILLPKYKSNLQNLLRQIPQ